MPQATFIPLSDQATITLTTFRKDGTPVNTAVSIAVVDEAHALIRTWSTSGKAKRIRRNARVLVAPSTTTGKPTGPAIQAEAHFVKGERAKLASRMLSEKHPLLHGKLVPFVHRLQGRETVYIELTPA